MGYKTNKSQKTNIDFRLAAFLICANFKLKKSGEEKKLFRCEHFHASLYRESLEQT